MAKTYPNGAIANYSELITATEVYEASRKFHCVSEAKRVNGLIVATLLDMNIPANSYNDWYLFPNESDAKEYADI